MKTIMILSIIIISIVITLPLFSQTNSFTQLGLSVNLKSRMYWGEINKKNLQLEDGKYFKAGSFSPIEEIRMNSGFSTGPEIELYWAILFIRGYYLQGRSNFDVGDVERKDIGIDFGLGYFTEKLRIILLVGMRKIETNFLNWNSENLVEDNISEPVLGLILATSPEKLGFIAHLEGVFGFKTFSGYEQVNVYGGELALGHRFKFAPLSVIFGFGAWGDWQPLAERVGIHIVGQQNLTYGFSLKISYNFDFI